MKGKVKQVILSNDEILLHITDKANACLIGAK
jgi:hypothetical protein